MVEAWLTWLRSIPGDVDGEDDPRTLHSLLAWEQVLFAIRQDLGHSKGSLRTGDLLRIYVYDADQAIRRTLGGGASD